jgi:hypothetical protein
MMVIILAREGERCKVREGGTRDVSCGLEQEVDTIKAGANI